jgi:hypothetical protein
MRADTLKESSVRLPVLVRGKSFESMMRCAQVLFYTECDLQALGVVGDGRLGVVGEGGAVVADDTEDYGDVGGTGIAGGEDQVGRVDVLAVLHDVASHSGEADELGRWNLREAGDLCRDVGTIAACGGKDLRACDGVGLVDRVVARVRSSVVTVQTERNATSKV